MRLSPKAQKRARETIQKDNEFYEDIWNEREHVCAECGRDLGDQISKYFMAHIWGKGANANVFRWDKRNIVLLCPDHHNQLDCSDKTEMKIYPMVEETIMMLKLEDSERNKPPKF